MEGNKPSSIFTCFLKCSWFFLFFYSLFWSIFDEIFWSSWKKIFSRARCFYLFIHFISLVSFYTPWKLKYEEFFVMVFRWTRWFHNGLYAGVKSFPCFQQIPYHFRKISQWEIFKLFLRVGNVFIYDAYFHTVFRAPFSLNYKSLLFQSQQVLLFFYLIKI